jgi:hypothetical protein
LEKNENNHHLMSDPLSNRIQHLEANPPPGAWQNIAAELSEMNAEKRISNKMLALESTPPEGSWNTINEQLHREERENKKPALIVPIRPLYPFLIRYGAVAIMIGLLAWVFIDNPFSQDPEKITTSIVPAKTSAAAPSTSATPPALEKTDVNTTAAVTDSEGPAKSVSREKIKRSPVYAKVARQAELIRDSRYIEKMLAHSPMPRTKTLVLSPVPAMQVLPVQNKDPRYITISNEKGEIIRLSAKFAPLYHSFFSNHENMQTNPAYNMLNQLQQQIIRQPFMPGPDNLFDLLRFRDLLEKEQ